MQSAKALDVERAVVGIIIQPQPRTRWIRYRAQQQREIVPGRSGVVYTSGCAPKTKMGGVIFKACFGTHLVYDTLYLKSLIGVKLRIVVSDTRVASHMNDETAIIRVGYCYSARIAADRIGKVDNPVVRNPY